MFQIRTTCGWCNQQADFRLVFASEYEATEPRAEGRSMANLGIRNVSDDDDVTAAGLSFCPLCRNPVLLTFNMKRGAVRRMIAGLADPGQTLAPIAAWGASSFPLPLRARSHDAWPSEVRELVVSAQLVSAQGLSPVMIATSCRTALEIAATRLGATGANLQAKIDDLASKAVITQPMKDWAHQVRLDGNAAVHEGTARDADELLEYVIEFLDLCFTLRAKIDARRAALAANGR